MAKSFLLERLKLLKGKKSNHKRNSVDGNAEIIEVDPLSNKPTAAWETLKEFHAVHQLPCDMYLHRPRQEDTLRFVCLSDTHGVVELPHREFQKRIPDGDVLIHCGDFTMGSNPSEIISFDKFMAKLPHPVKLVIAGNHEVTFEDTNPRSVRKYQSLPEEVGWCKALLQHLVYLEDETINICGIKIYGTPWVPALGSRGFALRRGENLLQKWNKIPSDTDILITHGPPCGYGDGVGQGEKRVGCVELLNTVVKRVKPKFHVFGHIHDGHGMWTNDTTTFINAAVCSNRFKPDFDPVVFDLPLPHGYSREDFAQLSTESLRQARQTTPNLFEQPNGCVNGTADYSDGIRLEASKEPEQKCHDNDSNKGMKRSSDASSNKPVEQISPADSEGATGF